MFIAEQLVHHWKHIFTDIILTKLLIVGKPDPIGSSTLTHFKGQNIIPLEATFDVLSVDVLLVPCCWISGNWSPGFKCLREPQPKVRIVYVCFISSLSFFSFRRLA